MASKSPQRVLELRELARALCMIAWHETNWNEQTVYANHAMAPVGDTVERVWLQFPSQGTSMGIHYKTSLTPPNSFNPSLCSYTHKPGSTRVEQIWWKIVDEQGDTFAGTGLLGTKVEVMTKPSQEAMNWAEEKVAKYGIPPGAGSYTVVLRAEGIITLSVTKGCMSSEDAVKQVLNQYNDGKSYGWTISEIHNPKVTEVKKA